MKVVKLVVAAWGIVFICACSVGVFLICRWVYLEGLLNSLGNGLWIIIFGSSAVAAVFVFAYTLAETWLYWWRGEL